MAQQIPQGVGAPLGKARVGGDAGDLALRWMSRNARTLAPLTTLIAMFAFFSLVTDTFLTTRNLQNVVTQIGPVAVAATGITFVLLCAEIDLSIASVATYAGMVTAFLYTGGQVSLGFTSFGLDWPL